MCIFSFFQSGLGFGYLPRDIGRYPWHMPRISAAIRGCCIPGICHGYLPISSGPCHGYNVIVCIRSILGDGPSVKFFRRVCLSLPNGSLVFWKFFFATCSQLSNGFGKTSEVSRSAIQAIHIPLATPENIPQRATSTPHFLLVKWVFECAETV